MSPQHDPKLSKKIFKDFLFLIPLSGFFLIFALGRGALASWDEAYHATISKEILQSGNWLDLTYCHTLWMNKPPLGFWATAFFYKLIGVSEFSSRIFSALCGVGTVLVTYLLGVRLYGRWVGFCGALILLSSSHFFHMARFGVLDVPLTFFLSLSLYFFWLGRERNFYFIFMGICLGLAFMIKSVATAPFFFIIFFHCLATGEMDILKRKSFWLSLGIAFLIILPWHVYAYYRDTPLFMTEMLGLHIFARATQALDGHTGNAYFYIRTLVNKYHPWILLGVLSGPYFLWRSIKKREAEIVFATAWMFSVLAIVTIARTKLAWYIIPAYPALSLSIGYLFAKIFKEKHPNHVRILFLIIMALHVPYSHIFDRNYASDVRGVSEFVKKEVPEDQPVYFYNNHENPALAFYAERIGNYLDDEQALKKQLANGQTFYGLFRTKDLKHYSELLQSYKVRTVGESEGLHFVTNKA